jgi:hypothetical protein
VDTKVDTKQPHRNDKLSLSETSSFGVHALLEIWERSTITSGTTLLLMGRAEPRLLMCSRSLQDNQEFGIDILPDSGSGLLGHLGGDRTKSTSS